eukprot:jgi/Bigna1/134792/aug1.26_g9500
MRAFYDQQGVGAWSNGIVPNFVTTNCCIAKMYANVIFGFLCDVFSPAGMEAFHVDPSQPLYIMELGAGHGKFSFLLMKHLLKMKEFLPETKMKVPFKFIMTDFTENNISFWQNHPSLRPFVKMGLVDFAKFDAENDMEIYLIMAKKTLNKHTMKNPMVLVANYIFDTLRHEAFRIHEGKLQEALITVTSERAFEPDVNDPGLIKRFRPKWSYRGVSHKDYFTGKQADLNPILERMVRRSALRNASILIPVGGINCLRNLIDLTGGRLFFLSGDKAYNYENEMKGLRDPHIAIHGSFSMMVNYDAVRYYFETRGGFSVHTPYQDGFKVAAFILGADRSIVKRGRLNFTMSLKSFGPDNFSTLQRSIKDKIEKPSLKLVLSLLRLSGYDSDVFYKFRQFLIDKLGHPYTSEKIQQDIRRDIVEIYSLYYPLSKSKDVAFEIGRLFMSMKDYKAAQRYFIDSIRDCGEHHVTHYNLGLCYNYIGEFASALKSFDRSLEIKPEYREAREWRNRESQTNLDDV